MNIWDALEQLGQQPDSESIAPEQIPVGIFGLLAQPANEPENLPLLGSSPTHEEEQPSGMFGQLRKGG